MPVVEGEYVRTPNRFAQRITADGSSAWPVAPGRYRLVVSLACPWANRALIVRRLLGLEPAISVAVADPIQDERSWRFTLDPGGRDPVLRIRYLAEAYHAADPDYAGGISVPAIVDVPSGKLVTNDYPQITLDFATQWGAHHRPGAPDLYPAARRAEIDELNEAIFHDVNNAVYQAGFATSQAAYERAYGRLFGRLDVFEDRLRRQRYLVGESITEPDVRLFTTLARFDAVYHGLFKCNRNKLTEYPALWAYARDLYQTPGFGDTTDFDHIKRHYYLLTEYPALWAYARDLYQTPGFGDTTDFDHIKRHYYLVHTSINPTGIVPVGPDPSSWLTPHGREGLGGRPFGDGTPPVPVPASRPRPASRPAPAPRPASAERAP